MIIFMKRINFKRNTVKSTSSSRVINIWPYRLVFVDVYYWPIDVSSYLVIDQFLSSCLFSDTLFVTII